MTIMHKLWAEEDLYDFGQPIDELSSGQGIEEIEVNVYFRRLAIQASG